MAMNPLQNSETTEAEGNGAASAAAPPKKPKWSKIKSAGTAQSPLLGALMFAPAVLYLALIIGGPFVLAVLYAFSDVRIGSTGMHYVGLENFRSIIQSPSFITSLKNSFIFTFFSQVIVIVGSTILAVALEKKFRGRGLVRFLILLPWVAPISLGAIGWKWILDSLYSVINWSMIALGLIDRSDAPNWLGNPHLAMLCVIVVNAWRFFPFAIVIFLAGITAVPQDVIDAATVDGAGFWRRNYQIIVPMILPIVTIGLIFGIVFTFTDLSIVFLMTMGGPIGATSVLGFAGFQTGITSGDVSHGAAISLFMLPVLFIVVIGMLRFIRRREI